MLNNILRFYAPLVVSYLMGLGQMDRFFAEECTSWTKQDSYGVSIAPQNIQEGQYFHFEKRSERYGALSRTLAPKHANYGFKAALGLNDEKIVGLVHLQTCSDCADFCL